MAITYTKVNKEFSSKKKANDFVEEFRGFKGNPYDRVYIKKEGSKYFIYKYQFPKTIQSKIEAIAYNSKYSFKILSYYEIAKKPVSWINNTYKKLST
jgi:hypothetical protein